MESYSTEDRRSCFRSPALRKTNLEARESRTMFHERSFEKKASRHEMTAPHRQADGFLRRRALAASAF